MEMVCGLLNDVLDEPVLRAIRHLFNNRFMKAKTIFEKQSSK